MPPSARFRTSVATKRETRSRPSRMRRRSRRPSWRRPASLRSSASTRSLKQSYRHQPLEESGRGHESGCRRRSGEFASAVREEGAGKRLEATCFIKPTGEELVRYFQTRRALRQWSYECDESIEQSVISMAVVTASQHEHEEFHKKSLARWVEETAVVLMVFRPGIMSERLEVKK